MFDAAISPCLTLRPYGDPVRSRTLSVAIVLSALCACGDRDRNPVERSVEKPKTAGESAQTIHGRLPGNPANIPGVKVYEPEYDFSLQYNPETHVVVDPVSGRTFWRRPAHADNVGFFGLSSKDNLPIQGSYYIHSATEADGKRAIIFDVASTFIVPGGDQGTILTPFDVAQLARFFRVEADSGNPITTRHFIVVDSRPIRGQRTS